MGLENPIHLLLVLVVMLLVFGAKRLPEMGRSLGSGLRGFRDALSGDVHAASAPSAVAAPDAAHAAPLAAEPVALKVLTADAGAPIATGGGGSDEPVAVA